MRDREPTSRRLGEDISWARHHVVIGAAVILCPAIGIGALFEGRWWVAVSALLVWIATVIEAAKWFGHTRKTLATVQAVVVAAGLLLYAYHFATQDWVWWPRAYVWIREGLRGLVGSP